MDVASPTLHRGSLPGLQLSLQSREEGGQWEGGCGREEHLAGSHPLESSAVGRRTPREENHFWVWNHASEPSMKRLAVSSKLTFGPAFTPDFPRTFEQVFGCSGPLACHL